MKKYKYTEIINKFKNSVIVDRYLKITQYATRITHSPCGIQNIKVLAKRLEVTIRHRCSVLSTDLFHRVNVSRFTFYLLLATCYLFLFPTKAQATTKVGTTAAQFLKIGVGARAIGMAESFNAIATDVTAIYWNPAGLGRLSQNELFFSHVDWLADISYDFIAVAFPLRGFRGTFGMFASSLSIPEEQVRTVFQPEGTGEFFDAGDLAIGFSYALPVTDRFSVGFVGKYIQESIWSMNASSIAFDIGTLYRSTFRNFKIGIVLSNFGTKMQLEGRANLLFVDPDPFIEGNIETIRAELEMGKWDLPLFVRTGIALDFIETKFLKVSYAVDMIHPNDNREFFNTGFEVVLGNIIFVRGGFRGYGMDQSEGGLAFGMGLEFPLRQVGSFIVDYAVTDFGRLSYVHHISAGLKF